MTINEAIVEIDELKPNTYSFSSKVKWLSELDGKIKKEIIDTHEGAADITFNGYNDDTDLETELLAPSPYSDIYLKWLESKIDYYNRELEQYNNTMSMFYTGYIDFRNYYNRKHMPIGQRLKL